MRRLLAMTLMLSLTMPAGVALADGTAAARLGDALRIREVLAVMAEEGLAYGDELEAEMFPDSGGATWDATVREIYDTDRIVPEFNAAFAAALSGPDSETDAMVAFFESDLGQRLTSLEISARRALLDQSVEEASRLKLEEGEAERDPRLILIDEFISANDLVEANVSGGLNANLAFYRGLEAAGALRGEMTEADILGEVGSQTEAIRAETDTWVHSYLFMAYAPLSDAEMKAYIAFSRTKAGKELNHALFAGFDSVFDDISERLGLAAGQVLIGHEL